MINPKISVIIPVYNVEKYIYKSIQSVCEQTYTNLEIILVNDGSTDSSKQICDYFAKKDSRIKLINQKNGGLSSARNAGIDQATGDYLGFVDSDDWIDSDMYAILVNQAISNNADISACNVRSVDENDTVIYINNNCMKKNKYLFNDNLKAINFIMYTKNDCVWNKLYKKHLFHNIRFPLNVPFEDVYIVPYIIESAKRVVLVSDVKYNYLLREGSISHSSFKNNYGHALLATIRNYHYFSDKYPELEKIFRRTIFLYFMYVMDQAYEDCILINKEEIITYINLVSNYNIENCGMPNDAIAMYRLIKNDTSLRSYIIARKINKSKDTNVSRVKISFHNAD